MNKGRIHFIIGDTQCRPGTPTAHLEWIGRYLVDQFAHEDVQVVHLGDHWDMPSLSSYDRGKKSMEGRRYVMDVEAGNEGWRILNQPLVDYNAQQAKTKHAQWWPDMDFLFGNHEQRIVTACENDAQLDGLLSLDSLITGPRWKRHAFKEIVEIDGISYSHFFYAPGTGQAYSQENLLTRLKHIGRTFTMGHQQGFNYCERTVGTKSQHGLVVGSTYLHDENYLGPQVKSYWRGIVVCHQVEEGSYDLMKVSLDFLCRKYTGATLKEFMSKTSGDVSCPNTKDPR